MADSETKRFALDFGSDSLQIYDEKGNYCKSSFALDRNESPSLYIEENEIKIGRLNTYNTTEFYKNIKYLVALDPKIPIFKGQMTPLVAGAIMLKKIIESAIVKGGDSEQSQFHIKEEDSTFVFTMTLSPEEQQIFKEMFKIAFPDSKIKIINEGITQTLALGTKLSEEEKKFYQINLDIGGSTNFLTFSEVEKEGKKINNIEQNVYMIPSGGKKIDKYLSEFILDVVLPIEYYIIKIDGIEGSATEYNNFKEIYDDYIKSVGNKFSKEERYKLEEKNKEERIIEKIRKAREEFNKELKEILENNEEKIKQFDRQISESAKKFKEGGFYTFNFLNIVALSSYMFQNCYEGSDLNLNFDSISTFLKEQTRQHFLEELQEVTKKILPQKLDKSRDFYITCTGGTAYMKEFKDYFLNNVKEIIKEYGYEEKK